VIPYAGIAQEVGKASATRAVAQALRWNPLPIVIPCHRVIGTSGALTGYAGSKIDIKQRLLSVEGVPTARKAGILGITPQTMYMLYPGIGSIVCPPAPLSTRAGPRPSRASPRARMPNRWACSPARPAGPICTRFHTSLPAVSYW